jgi:putative transposase
MGPSEPQQLEGARECDRQEATRRMGILEESKVFLSHLGDGRRKTAAIRQFVIAWNDAHPGEERLSVATLYRWARLYRERGVAGLLPGWATGSKECDLHPEIRERFDRSYLAPQRISIPVARRIVQGELALAGSPLAAAVPSTATFRRYVAGLPRATVVLAREGEQAFRRRFEPHAERDYTTVRVMQCWIADHAQFDFFCRDENGKPVRPWLTLWQDMRSRRRVGWQVHTGPSQDTVLAALAMGIMRYGIPEEAYTDNGRDFSVLTVAGSSRRWRLKLDEGHVQALTQHFGMRWHFAIPKRPQGKGGIERPFGVDRERFDKLWASYCGRNDQEKPEGLAALLKRPRDLPGIPQVQEAYTRYATEVADLMPHEGQGMDGRSPREVFEAEEYVKGTATIEALRLLLMRSSRPVRVQRNGIWAFDRWYWSVELAACHGQEVYYRYALDDLSVIHVLGLQDQYLCSVRRRDLVGVTSQDHRKYVREKQAIRRVARAYLANRDRQASAPDALAAIGASIRMERPDGPRPEDPGPRPAVVKPIRTPFEGAARAIKKAEQRAATKARAEQAAAKGQRLYPGPTGRSAPDPDAVRRENADLRERYQSEHG